MRNARQRRLSALLLCGAAVCAMSAFGRAAQADGVYVVQIAAVKSESRAKDEWNRLQSRHVELLGDMNLMLQRVELGDRGVFFRMQTGPFPNKTTAQDMCQQLQAEDMDCIVAQR